MTLSSTCFGVLPCAHTCQIDGCGSAITKCKNRIRMSDGNCHALFFSSNLKSPSCPPLVSLEKPQVVQKRSIAGSSYVTQKCWLSGFAHTNSMIPAWFTNPLVSKMSSNHFHMQTWSQHQSQASYCRLRISRDEHPSFHGES